MHIKVPTVCGAINTVLGIIAVCRQATIHNASSCLVTFCVVKLCSLSGSTFIPSYSSQYKSNYEVNVNIIEEQLTHSLLTIYVVINGLALVWPHSLFTSNIHVCAHPPPLRQAAQRREETRALQAHPQSGVQDDAGRVSHDPSP